MFNKLNEIKNIKRLMAALIVFDFGVAYIRGDLTKSFNSVNASMKADKAAHALEAAKAAKLKKKH